MPIDGGEGSPRRPADAGSATVVHFVGTLTDTVFGFVGPASEALVASGVRQVVVLAAHAGFSYLLPRFHPSIELRLVPEGCAPWRRWQLLRRLFRDVVVTEAPATVHLHGTLPALVAAGAIRRHGRPEVKIFFSPHGSRTLGQFRVVGRPVLRVLRWLYGPYGLRPIANLTWEALSLDVATVEAVELVETPVAQAFFEVQHGEARHPLIVTGSRVENAQSADLFAQLAVLLASRHPIAFNWIGAASDASTAKLSAAGVAVFDSSSEPERASRLSAGWIFVVPNAARGFPVYLAEAMAAGLPCVVADSPQHGDLVEDGRTGFLCGDVDGFVQRIEQLIDAPELRRAVGEAARTEARLRFSVQRFRGSILKAYQDVDEPRVGTTGP